jgi:hypothetical protein
MICLKKVILNELIIIIVIFCHQTQKISRTLLFMNNWGPQILAFLESSTSGNQNIVNICIEGLSTKFQDNMSKTESRK